MADINEQIAKSRHDFYKKLGKLTDERILSPMALFAWPSGSPVLAAFKNGKTLFVATDGLADPSEDMPEGLKMELIMATAEPLKDENNNFMVKALQELSTQIADHGEISELLEEIGTISGNLSSLRDVPASYVAPDGSVGILVNVRSKNIPESFETPIGKVKVVVCRLLQANEIEDAMSDDGDAAREKFKKLFEKEEHPELENLNRKSFSTTVIASAPAAGATKALPEPGGTPTSSLMLTGLNAKTTEDELKALFGKHGTVVKIKIMSGPMAGMAMVDMDTAEAGHTAAKNLNGFAMHGQPFQINYAKRR